jgi:hypothetical protein
MPLPLDAQRLAHQGSLGWRRQMVEVQTAFVVAVLIEAAECESPLHEAPMPGRFAPDIEQVSETVSEDVARLPCDASIAAFVAPHRQGRGVEGFQKGLKVCSVIRAHNGVIHG